MLPDLHLLIKGQAMAADLFLVVTGEQAVQASQIARCLCNDRFSCASTDREYACNMLLQKRQGMVCWT